MASRKTLGRQVLGWLVGYVALATLLLFGTAHYLHERAEHMVWRSLLSSELDAIRARGERDPDYRWQDSDTLSLFRLDAGGAPPELKGLRPGLHDDVVVQGRPSAVMVRITPKGTFALVLDITDFEALERFLTRWMLLASVTLIALTLLMGRYGMARLVRPLEDLARRIGALRPERLEQRIEVDPHGSSELFVIGDAVNDYLDRTEHFVERERNFIDSTSHELRTPIAVIRGASELALEQPGATPAVRQQLQRIRQTAESVEQLVTLLLVLAKDPSRLEKSSDYVRLDELLPDILDDHRHLCADKDLELWLAELPRCELFAPVAIMQVAIGNLLRNAIEHSDRGVVRVSLLAPATVRVDDPGHGMSPEEISAIYRRMARGDARQGSGIGLDLLGRLCEHLGWKLQLDSATGQGTVATLDMSGSVVESRDS
ncbi:MAG: HAMP domain-containing sensor histidine kinase [Pseudomonas sp.]